MVLPFFGAGMDSYDFGVRRSGPSPGDLEPAIPLGWSEVLYDDFQGTSLNRQKWGHVYSGPHGSNAWDWDPRGIVVNNGLTLRMFQENGRWKVPGFSQGNLAVNAFQGYSDFQATVKIRVPAGKGVGPTVVMWPVSDTWPPEFDILETPGADKQTAMLTWHWRGVNGEDVYEALQAPHDLTNDTVITVRRIGSNFRVWIDGIEQQVPVSWAQHPQSERLSLGFGSFVAAAGDTWYGGAPDGTTPVPFESVVSYVRLSAPNTTSGGSSSFAQAQAFVADTTIGPNLERPAAWNVTTNFYADYLRNTVGQNHVRMFYPYRPTQNFGHSQPGTNGRTEDRPTKAQFARILDAAQIYINKGIKVFLDCLDVIGYEDFQPAGWQAHLEAHLQDCGAWIRERNFNKNLLAVGPVNEWAGGTNEVYNPVRVKFHQILRDALPGYILTTGGCGWKGRENFIEGTPEYDSFLVFDDPLVVYEWHFYGTWDKPGFQWLADQMANWRAKHGGRPTICGELGIDPSQAWEFAAFIPFWDNALVALANEHPLLWSVSDYGSMWKINKDGWDARYSDGTQGRPDYHSAMVRLTQEVRNALGTLPPPVEQPPAAWQPSSLGSALLFAGNANDDAATPDGSSYGDIYESTRKLVSGGSAAPAISTTGGAKGNQRVVTLSRGAFLKADTSSEAVTHAPNTLDAGQGSFTLIISARIENVNDWTFLAVWADPEGNYLQIRQNPEGKMALQLSLGGEMTQVEVNQRFQGWHTFTAIKDGSLLTLRADGQPLGSVNLTSTAALAFDQFAIGASAEVIPDEPPPGGTDPTTTSEGPLLIAPGGGQGFDGVRKDLPFGMWDAIGQLKLTYEDDWIEWIGFDNSLFRVQDGRLYTSRDVTEADAGIYVLAATIVTNQHGTVYDDITVILRDPNSDPGGEEPPPDPTGIKVLASSFEGITVNAPSGSFSTLSGTDTVTGHNWANAVWGSRPRIQLLNGSVPGQLEAKTVEVPGPTGALTRVLQLECKEKPTSTSQVSLLIEPTAPPTEWMIRCKMKLPADLATQLGPGGWWTIGPEFKTAGDFRVTNVIEVVGSTPRWTMKWDNDANGGLYGIGDFPPNGTKQEFYYNQNTTDPVPVGEWFDSEAYFKVHPTEGRAYLKINGTIVNDHTGNTTGVFNKAVNRIFVALAYPNNPGMIQVDDLEIWDLSNGGTPTPGGTPMKLYANFGDNTALPAFRTLDATNIGTEEDAGGAVATTGTEHQLAQFISGRAPAGGFTLPAGAVSFVVSGGDPNGSGLRFRAKLFKRTAAGAESLIGSWDNDETISTWGTFTWNGTIATPVSFAEDDRLILRLFVFRAAGGTLQGGWVSLAVSGDANGNPTTVTIPTSVAWKAEA